ncbi:MAG: PHP domain-containing protein [Oscillospiraceae bacterium]
MNDILQEACFEPAFEQIPPCTSPKSNSNLKPIKYDLHIHSCLSPCGDNEMTPEVIAGIAKLNGLDVFALTDHNSTANCKSAAIAAKNYDIGFIAGMELSTSEDIHILCLFPNWEKAEIFGEYVYNSLPNFKNSPEIFGEQNVTDENGNIVEQVDKLLINATEISISQVENLVKSYGGIAIPSHINKTSNSVMAILGGIPEECLFPTVELSNNDTLNQKCLNSDELKGKIFIKNSDAHYPWDISKGENIILAENNDFFSIKKALNL